MVFMRPTTQKHKASSQKLPTSDGAVETKNKYAGASFV